MRRALWATLLAAAATAGAAALPAAAGPMFVPPDGERLIYKIYVAGLALGQETLAIEHGQDKNGRPVVIMEQRLDSYPLVSALIDYHERRILYWDPISATPIREEATLTRQKRISRERMEFLPERGVIVYTGEAEDGRTGSKTFPFQVETQTGCSLLLYLRTFPWERGSRRLAVADVLGVAVYEFVAVPETGVFRAPIGSFPRTYHLSNRELKHDIWFDRGPDRLPLEIRSRLAFGSAQAKLVEARKD